MATTAHKVPIYEPHFVVQAIDLHAAEYANSSDETYERNASCAVCRTAYPCDTRKLLEAALDL
jgi:hypothetical protein